MKLRKLELFGFKSFYDKTAFEFSDGITAIVGPNGCGKSNVVDAVRWVLGEHAPTYLRSKALEDVIFAGSDAAGPLGMAEVTLTFSNENGDSPPGYESYSEIQITRRAFRDGESEFLINRVPCRLKDIAELFLDTGAGARGYAIIEQGKIMTIVNARPDEKRMIIEEAAGVARFRVRRKEAERKMESTRQNLARVRDILEEVKRQLGSLERQVRKAERYKALREELRALDLRIAGELARRLQEDGDRIARELGEAEGEQASSRATAAALDADREAERLRHAEAERVLADLRSAHGALKEEISRREGERGGKESEARQLSSLAAETALEIEALRQESEGFSERLEAEEREERELGQLLLAARERLRILAEGAAVAREESERLRESAEQSKSDLMVRVSHHSSALVSAESLSRHIEEGGRKLARLVERVEAASGTLASAEGEHAEALRREEEEAGVLAAVEAEREELGARLQELAARMENAESGRRDLEGRLAAARSRNTALSRIQEQRHWASEGARAILDRYSGSGIGGDRNGEGIYGLVGELIETEAEYERAVEAVLGERIQSVVVRGQEEGISALRYLKESGEGRGSFVPVTLRTRGEEAVSSREEGIIAPLAEVVRVPEECRKIVGGLLGGTLLVRDLECALRIWNRNGLWNSFVTLDGDLLTADGILAGGSQGEGESRVLAVRREIRHLEGEIASLGDLASEAAAEEERLRARRALLEERRERVAAGREECRLRYAEASRVRAMREAALAQERAGFEALRAEREYAIADQARLEGEREALAEAARESGTARTQEEERVRDLAARAQDALARWEEARAACHAAEVEGTGLEEKRRAAGQRLEGLRDARGERKARFEERMRRRVDLEERAARLFGEADRLREEVEAGQAELSRRQEEIESHLGRSAAFAARIGSLETGWKEARIRENAAAERLGELRLADQRIRMEAGSLDDRIHQRYEMRLSDLPAPEGPVPADEELASWEGRAEEVRDRMSSLGEVNLASLEEHRELAERHAFLSAQRQDLERSLEDLSRAIHRINRTTRERFALAFDQINRKFQETFPRLFQGGRATLRLLDEENLLESGVEIVAQPPGKKLQNLNLLSGGEKALTAVSLIFAIFLVKPSPFCLLDEADAPLDDANIDRFNALVREMAARYQFLLITHNKRTMELADALYGITMEKPGISKVVSVRFHS